MAWNLIKRLANQTAWNCVVIFQIHEGDGYVPAALGTPALVFVHMRINFSACENSVAASTAHPKPAHAFGFEQLGKFRLASSAQVTSIIILVMDWHEIGQRLRAAAADADLQGQVTVVSPRNAGAKVTRRS